MGNTPLTAKCRKRILGGTRMCGLHGKDLELTGEVGPQVRRSSLYRTYYPYKIRIRCSRGHESWSTHPEIQARARKKGLL